MSPHQTLYYLAYGSNLHPLRLQERVPSAALVRVLRLPDYRLAFHKRSVDGSGKCNLLPSAGDCAHAALYRLSAPEKVLLDRFEGVGYDAVELALTLDGEPIRPFVYLAHPSHVEERLAPYHWYKALVLAGAQHLQFPIAYIEQLRAVHSCQDPDLTRRRQHEALLERLRDWPDRLDLSLASAQLNLEA